jgi:hypothetical protein
MTAYTFSQLFDFTRTTAATFVGSNGLIQNTPASRNLLTFTQEFDNAVWSKNSSTITANTAIAPDGTATADKLSETAVTAAFSAVQAPTMALNTTHTFSVYMKAVERSFGVLNIFTGVASCWTWYDLATGSVSTLGAGATATISAVGGGWYRCTLTIATAASGSPNVAIWPAISNGVLTYAGTAGSGILIWGAQLEAGSTATTYTRNNGGVFPARFDYDPVTLAPRGILIEEQRTNLATYSNDFADASWVALSAKNVVANTTVSPDGSVNASTLTDNSAVAYQGIAKSVTVANDNATYTASVYVRKTTGGTSPTFGVNFQISGGTVVTAQPRLNTDTGTLINGTGTVQNAGAYWRLICTITNNTSGNTSLGLSLYPATSAYNVPADSAAATGSAIIYGAQLEAGTFATSYIPTVASQVTRSADLCAITAPMFAPWYSQSQGTMVVEFVSNGINTVSSSLAAISDGTGNNILLPFINAGGVSFVSVLSGGATSASLNTGAVTVRAIAKHASAYQADSFSATLNGAAPTVDTAGPVPVGANVMNIGWAAPYGGLYLNGHIRSVRYYPFRASNNQLQALTT